MKYKNYVKGLGETKVMAVCTKNYSKMWSVPKLLSQAVNFPDTTIIQYQVFWHGHSFFHLDNPVQDTVETETISNPNPKKS